MASDNDIIERLARIETKLEVLATVERMAAVEASAKQAHIRITELEKLHDNDKKSTCITIEKSERRIYWTAGAVFTVVQAVINFFMRQ